MSHPGARRPDVPGAGDPPPLPTPRPAVARLAAPRLTTPFDGTATLTATARRSARRRRLVRTGMVAGTALVGAVLLVAVGGGAKAPAVTVRSTLAATAPIGVPSAGATVTSSPSGPAPAAAPGSGGAAPLPWPASGQSAVSVPATGFRDQSGVETTVPVASLTKIMTAYVVLRDHPLAPGRHGPAVTITPADAANFGLDTVTDQASVELQAGEVLTEYQLLEGLLVHSANDFAFVLATWDAGSVNAFVAKMNASSAALGMRATHFADASGFATGSTSTAADLLTVAAAAMADPVFAAIVRMPSVTLPVAGEVASYTPLVGTTPGVVGVKSGFTDAAGGGDVLAYQTSVGGHTLLVLAAVTSLEGPTVLATAGNDALTVARAVAGRVAAVTVAAARTVVGRVTEGAQSVAATTAAPATLLAVPGATVRQSVRLKPPRPGAPPGTVVGTATFRLGTQVVSVPVATASRLP